MQLVKRGGLQMKCWDIGGQAQYRSEWGRYTRGCDVVIFVVDTHGTPLTQQSVKASRLFGLPVVLTFLRHSCTLLWP